MRVDATSGDIMTNQKGSATIALIVVLIVVAVISLAIYFDFKDFGYIRYYVFHKGMPPGMCDPGPCVTPTPDETANWKTYANQLYDFQFKYPIGWTINDQSFTYKGQNYMTVVFASPLISGVPGANREAYFYTTISKKNGSWQHKEGINLSLLFSEGGATPVNVSQQYLESREEFRVAQLIFSSVTSTAINEKSNWKTYTDSEYGFEFRYNPNWSTTPINTGSGYDASKPFILLRAGLVSDAPCQDLGCPPKSGDRDVLTKGDTLEGAPPLNPWFKILRVRGNKWVSIQVTDLTKNFSSETECQQYLSQASITQKTKVSSPGYQIYNDFIDLVSTFKFTK